MRAEKQAVYDRAEAIKSAGRHTAARLAVFVETMEREGHFDTRPDSEDWDLVDTLIEAAATSKHFTHKHGDDLNAYDLFRAAAKLEFYGVFNLRENSKALAYEEKAYIEEWWTSKLPELEASELRMSRAP